jgi:hypothetical protein
MLPQSSIDKNNSFIAKKKVVLHYIQNAISER